MYIYADPYLAAAEITSGFLHHPVPVCNCKLWYDFAITLFKGSLPRASGNSHVMGTPVPSETELL